MTKNEYKKKIVKALKSMKIKEEVKVEILNDLEEFFLNDSRENLDIEKHLGEPKKFIDGYLTDEDINSSKNIVMKILKKMIINFLAILFCILILAPIIWGISFVFKIQVEVGYLFQFLVSLVMFATGFGGLYTLIKKNWL